MNLRISQGQATRSVCGCSRVTHCICRLPGARGNPRGGLEPKRTRPPSDPLRLRSAAPLSACAHSALSLTRLVSIVIDEHRHDDGLARSCRHLERDPVEAGVTRLAVLAELVLDPGLAMAGDFATEKALDN